MSKANNDGFMDIVAIAILGTHQFRLRLFCFCKPFPTGHQRCLFFCPIFLIMLHRTDLTIPLAPSYFPPTICQLCNVGAWTVMASAATRMGIMEIAAHQLMLSLWLVIAFIQGENERQHVCDLLKRELLFIDNVTHLNSCISPWVFVLR